MEALILLIIFGLGASYFATQNTGNVHILLGGFMISSIPLYIVVIGSILLGVFISWLINIANSFSTMFVLRGKDVALKTFQEKIDDLQERNNQLEEKLSKFVEDDSAFEKDSIKKQESVEKTPLLYQLKHGMRVSLH